MKRLLSTLILAIVCAASSAQDYPKGNPQIDSLFAELKEIIGPESTKHFMERQLLNDGIGTALREQIWIGKGQHGTDLDRRMEKAITLIRRRLDYLAERSIESYRFEVHKDGKDTIQYAINLTDKSVKMTRIENTVDYGEAAEDITFNYYTDRSGQFSNGSIHHAIRYNVLKELADSSAWRYGYFDPDDSFRYEDFNKMIAKLMNRKGVTRRAVHWESPMPGANEDNAGEKYYMRSWFGKEDSKGETIGVDYSVPIKNADLANDLLRQLNDSIHGFFKANPIQVYTIWLDKEFVADHATRLLFAQYQTDSSIYDGLYDVYLVQDADAYHFLFLDTRGSLWIPRKF